MYKRKMPVRPPTVYVTPAMYDVKRCTVMYVVMYVGYKKIKMYLQVAGVPTRMYLPMYKNDGSKNAMFLYRPSRYQMYEDVDVKRLAVLRKTADKKVNVRSLYVVVTSGVRSTARPTAVNRLAVRAGTMSPPPCTHARNTIKIPTKMYAHDVPPSTIAAGSKNAHVQQKDAQPSMYWRCTAKDSSIQQKCTNRI